MNDHVFSDLEPMDFYGQTITHVDVTRTPFDRFLDTSLFALRSAFVFKGGSLTGPTRNGSAPMPFIIVANEQNFWPLASPGGQFQRVTTWVRDEMATRGASWVFLALQVTTAWSEGPFQGDLTDPGELAKVKDSMRLGLAYYCGRRTESGLERRHGVIGILGEDLGPANAEPADRPNALFDAILS